MAAVSGRIVPTVTIRFGLRGRGRGRGRVGAKARARVTAMASTGGGRREHR